MSTKCGIYFDEATKTYLYEEALPLPDQSDSPAYIQVGGDRFNICHDFADKNPQVTVEVDAKVMDQFAIAWCKHRNLQGALGGPVGKEFGSPDCEYD
mgnify:CR=1 FL=1|tara:strand:- start:1652 stop:1942 length:291 start_codon:yes stop_codon:yes gene_type:complete